MEEKNKKKTVKSTPKTPHAITVRLNAQEFEALDLARKKYGFKSPASALKTLALQNISLEDHFLELKKLLEQEKADRLAMQDKLLLRISTIDNGIANIIQAVSREHEDREMLAKGIELLTSSIVNLTKLMFAEKPENGPVVPPFEIAKKPLLQETLKKPRPKI